MSEHRRFKRVNFIIDTELTADNVSCRAETVNISLRGILVRPKEHFSCVMKNIVTISIVLNDDIRLTFEGIKVHEEDGMQGFRFVETDLDSITHLRALLENNLGDSAEVIRELEFLADD